MEKYDYIIVGAGFFGSICAYELNKLGKKILVLEKRKHIGGNCYTEKWDNINIHYYGPHIFHTSNEMVWKWINQFTSFNNFILTPIANYNDELYSLPFNMWTFYKMWNISSPEEVKMKIIEQSSLIKGEPKNLEEQAIKLVGIDIYEKLIKGYTEKQWRKSAVELPIDIIKRLPVRFTYNNNYFNDKYQGIPIGGYTQIFEKLLYGIDVKTDVDYLNNKDEWDSMCDKVIFTGPIDRFYDFRFGELEYKTTEFKHVKKLVENYQGSAVINFTHSDIPYTRIIEHKHFENNESPVTWLTYEYPVDYDPKKNEPFYPVNDKKNNTIYQQYKTLSESNPNILFGGRLGEYKYYDMDKVIDSGLKFIQQLQIR